LIPAANVTLAAPRGTRSAIATGRVGAAAAISASTPKPSAAPVTSLGPTCVRLAVASAPTTDPAAIATASAVYAPAPPSNAKRASSGRSVWKLNPSVPTTAIIASGMASAGVRATWRRQARTAPRRRGAGGAGPSSAGFIARSATIIAPKLAALTRKHGSTPQRRISPPAIAGPITREAWTRTLLRLTALTTRSGPTISMTKLWRAGFSIEFAVPRMKTRAKTIHGATTPVTVTAKRVSAGTAIASWVIVIRRRFGMRSASTPPQAAKSSIGRNCRADTMPTATPLPVSARISHTSATIWVQFPLVETSWPAKKRR
jgi:hypothetical protein